MVYILYNPLSNAGDNDKQVAKAMEKYSSGPMKLMTVTEIKDKVAFFENQLPGDETVLLGGDGTLNRLVNDLDGYVPKNKLWLYKAGTGNDFMNDVFGGNVPDETFLQINKYIENLPRVTINDKTYRFVNNCSFGIDGKVCSVGEEQKARGKSKINYTMLAARLLMTYKPANVRAIVDGVEYKFKDVWLAPTMNGRYYGGGMKVAPMQDRDSDVLTLIIFHKANRWRTLTIFPRIFSGSHIKFKQYFIALRGREIAVEYDVPQDVQMDGEVLRGITSYSAVKEPVTVHS